MQIRHRSREGEPFTLVQYSGRIGDFLVALPYLRKYSEQKNTVFILPKLLMPIASRALECDIVYYDSSKFSYNFVYRYKVYGELGRYHIAKAVNVCSFSRAQHLILGTDAKEKICYEGEYIHHYAADPFFDRFYTKIIPNPYASEKSIEHISVHNGAICQALTGEGFRPTAKDYRELMARLTDEKILQQYQLKKGSYLVFVTDASTTQKMFPAIFWQKIVDYFTNTHRVVLIGVQQSLIENSEVVNLTGKTKLPEAFGVLANAKAVLSNDTGPAHFAYLSGVPTVCILGGGHFGRFLPWFEFSDKVECVYHEMECFGCDWKCPYVSNSTEVVPCISSIDADTVIAKMTQVLEKV